MEKSRTFRLEAAGWGFFVAAFVVLLAPCIYAAFQLVEEHYSRTIPVGIGVIFAAFAAAMATFATNTVLQSMHARQKRTAQKQKKRK